MVRTRIGLEIHIQLKTSSKLFCSCSTSSFGAPANTNICPICTAQPGVLPVLNREVLEKLLLMACAFNCQIASFSRFARKNYFYPDLPKNYQISQYEEPLAAQGQFSFFTSGEKRTIRVTRIHLEEDVGKLLHAIGSQKLDSSLVDFNRAGIPLAEMVTEPDLASSQEASDFLQVMRATFKALDASNCDMEKGEMRVDVNVSVAPDAQALGTKVEIKNLNSFKAVRDALDFEITRQQKAREAGIPIVQETRLWNAKINTTQVLRNKEEASDYRYFPEPDLVPLEISSNWAKRVKSKLGELPMAKLERYQREFGLTLKEAQAILYNEDREIKKLFEETLALAQKKGSAVASKTALNWILNSLLAYLKEKERSLNQADLSPGRFLEFLETIQQKNLPTALARELFIRLLDEPNLNAQKALDTSGFVIIDSQEAIARLLKKIIHENPKPVKEFLAGKEKALGALMGALMRETKGQIQPQKAQELLRQELAKPRDIPA